MTRVNILSNSQIAGQFVDGVRALKDPQQSPWPGQAGLSLYDFFVYWHWRSMMLFTPPSQQDRNGAHSGPVFLPWHRYMLLRLEDQLRGVLGDDEFRLPYWEWTADSALDDPAQSPLWESDLMGQFVDGSWRVRLLPNAQGEMTIVDRALRRRLGMQAALPSREAVRAAVRDEMIYDTPSFDSFSTGFRNLLEGWIGPERIHNNVHVWVGGDMVLGTSPNDPVFFLHHCNIDRIWSAWQASHAGAQYVPEQSASDELAFHRIDDQLFTFFDEAVPVTPRGMLDHSALYEYDTLSDLTS
jgi:tyrosinase